MMKFLNGFESSQFVLSVATLSENLIMVAFIAIVSVLLLAFSAAISLADRLHTQPFRFDNSAQINPDTYLPIPVSISDKNTR